MNGICVGVWKSQFRCCAPALALGYVSCLCVERKIRILTVRIAAEVGQIVRASVGAKC